MWYGQGLMLAEFSDTRGRLQRWLAHYGGAAGLNAVTAWDLERRCHVAVVSNSAAPAAAVALALLETAEPGSRPPHETAPRAGLRVLVLVVLLHAAGLWLLLNGRGGDAAPAAVARIAVRCCRCRRARRRPHRAASPPRPGARANCAATPGCRAPARSGRAAGRAAGTGRDRHPAPLPADAPASQALAEPPPSLMDGEATRRAIRAAGASRPRCAGRPPGPGPAHA